MSPLATKCKTLGIKFYPGRTYGSLYSVAYQGKRYDLGEGTHLSVGSHTQVPWEKIDERHLQLMLKMIDRARLIDKLILLGITPYRDKSGYAWITELVSLYTVRWSDQRVAIYQGGNVRRLPWRSVPGEKPMRWDDISIEGIELIYELADKICTRD